MWSGKLCVLADAELDAVQTAFQRRLAADRQADAACDAALRSLALILEAWDSEIRGHTDRVTELALRMAEALCWSPSQTRALRWGAYLHDIGKLDVPDAVLLKPGPLDAAEWTVMRSHVEAGLRFAAGLDALPEASLRVVRDHMSAGMARVTRRAREATRSVWKAACSRCVMSTRHW